MDSSVTGIAQQVHDLLDAVTPATDLDDDELRTRLVECEQAMAMLEAVQAEAMVKMGASARAADRAESDTAGRPLWSRECREEFVADEIAVLLACTKMAANQRYGTAWQAAQLPVVAMAWRAGKLDARKASTICEQAGLLTGEQAHELADAAVAYTTAPGRSRTAPQLREWLRRRVIAVDPAAAEARRQRALSDRRVVITPGDDGTSELWALLPSVQARQIQQALTATAQQLGADDARTMDQRRADALVDLLLGRGEPAAVSVGVMVPADTFFGTGDGPAWVPGLGPITAGEVSEILGAATAGLGCAADRAGVGAGGSGLGVPTRSEDGGQRWSFRWLLTDPASGALTAVAERRYRPSAALNRAVRARDVTCRFPGCRRSADAASTDLDHTVPWPGGQTSAANLATLCRRHHRLKHTAGWSVALDPTGVMTWTTPTGRTVTTEPWHYADPPPRE